ncbi:hypothetical protein ACFLVP_04070 [Chloroflexota bacterium]
MNANIDQQCERETLTRKDEGQLLLSRRAYSKLCNAIRGCLDDEEKAVVNGMYLFLHLDFPEDNNLHIDMVRNIPSSTDIRQYAEFKKSLTAAEIDLELDVIREKECGIFNAETFKGIPCHIE